ncbi:hypothetical protein ACFE04_011739 [Oxalis oulophora]
MTDDHQQQQVSDDDNNNNKPIVIKHRLPTFPTSILSFLSTHFHLIDPLLSTTIPHHSVLALVSVGPSPVTSETLDQYPSLKIVVGSSAGVDHIDLAECRRRGISVTNAGDAFTDDVADYAVGLLISVLRRVSGGDRYVKDGLWAKNGDYPLAFKVSSSSPFLLYAVDLFGYMNEYVDASKTVLRNIDLGGKRVGIVGLGSIGSGVAKRLVPFGFLTPESLETLNSVVLGNLKAFFSNEPLISPV